MKLDKGTLILSDGKRIRKVTGTTIEVMSSGVVRVDTPSADGIPGLSPDTTTFYAQGEWKRVENAEVPPPLPKDVSTTLPTPH